MDHMDPISLRKVSREGSFGESSGFSTQESQESFKIDPEKEMWTGTFRAARSL